MKKPTTRIGKYHTNCKQCGKDMFGKPMIVYNDKWLCDNGSCYTLYSEANPVEVKIYGEEYQVKLV
jgi:hypothetical protein